MAEKLTQKELEKIVEKLRGQYEEQKKLYGPVYFNVDAFNDRYLAALRGRIDLQTFVYAEVTALEELKQIIQVKIRERAIRTEKPFTRKIEKMLDAMAEKTRKHTALFEESGLPEEFQRLCGGLRDFHDREWLLLEKLIDRNEPKSVRTHADLSSRFQKYFVHSRGGLSYEAERFLTVERREGYDKAHISFLRETAVLLRDAGSFLAGPGLDDSDEPLRLEVYSPGLEEFKNRPRREILALIRDRLAGFAADFRLSDLSL